MLLAAGPNITALKDYTAAMVLETLVIQSQQGTQLDTLNVDVRDPARAFTLAAEDDIVALDENDLNGWPTVNLLLDPSFEGTYDANGVAPNWSRWSPSTTGQTYAKNTSTVKFGAASQSISWTNIGPSTPAAVGIFQNITLPTDEKGNPLIAQPYYFSLYVDITGAVSGGTSWNINLQFWADVNRTIHAGTYSTPLPLGATTSGWVRYMVGGLPQASAIIATVSVVFNSNNATNGGTVLLDGAQLEYATFANVGRQASYVVPLLNPILDGTVGGTTPTSWSARETPPPTGFTQQVVNVPVLNNTAQQLTLSSVAAGSITHGIQQINLPILTVGRQDLTLLYQVTQALTGDAQAHLGVKFLDWSFQIISDVSAFGPVAEGISSDWETLTLSIGPGTSHPMPSNTAYLQVYAGVSNTTQIASGVVVLGEIDIAGWLGNPNPISALTAGLYPTPYCDAAQPGCYTDSRLAGSLAYRQFRRFGGFVKRNDRDYTNGPERVMHLQCTEYGILLGEAKFSGNFAKINDNLAIAQVVSYAQQQGYLAGLDGSTFIQFIAAIDSQSFSLSTAKDALDYIANQTMGVYYVDYHLRLHYYPALAQSAPFALSDTPNLTTSFPYQNLVIGADSTNTSTEPIIEGATQTSAPQTYTANGVSTTTHGPTATLSAALGSTGLTALPVSSGGASFLAGMQVTIGPGTANAEVCTVGSGSVATSIVLATATTKTHSSGDSVDAGYLLATASYTEICVTATTAFIPKGTVVLINAGSSPTAQFTTTADAQIGATTLAVVSHNPGSNFVSGTAVAIGAYFTVFSGNAIAFCDSITAGGTAQTVGLASQDTLGSNGVTALYDPATGLVYLLNAISSSQTIVVVFRFTAPVLVLVHATAAEAPTGSVRRKIFSHTKLENITSKQSAIDRANAAITQNGQPQPIITLTIQSPPIPAGSTLRPGMAISFTNAAEGYSAVLMQIQTARITSAGNGLLFWELQLGFYRPDAIMLLYQHSKRLGSLGSSISNTTLINDVLTFSGDGWTLLDSIALTRNNIGKWGGVTSSTWDGTFVWG